MFSFHIHYVNAMLSTELQPSVRQIVQRNEELEEENKQLYDKVHQLLTEVTALRAIRSHYESLVGGRGSQLLSPSPQALRETVRRQKRQIARLQARLDSAEADAQTLATEKAELEQRLERNADTLEKTAQLEADAGQECTAVARKVRALISLCRKTGFNRGGTGEQKDEEPDVPKRSLTDGLSGAVQALHRQVGTLADQLRETAKGRQQLGMDYHNARQTISELETQIRVLETEKTATDECNARYDDERQELGEAIATLRSALEETKKRLVTAEEDKKKLKTQNARLKLELEKLNA
jgi:chromosome segregation ATPase